MPSALETLVKILKLEQNTDYKNTAVIGGLESFAKNWVTGAHEQAKRAEHHQLVDELVVLMNRYADIEDLNARHETVKYMMGRIMGRIEPPPDLPLSTYVDEEEPEDSPAHPPALAAEDSPPDVVSSATETRADDDADDTGDDTGNTAENDHKAYREGDEGDGEEEEDFVATEPEPQPEPFIPPRRRARHLPPEEAAQHYGELRAPVTTLPRIGEKMAEKLDILGIRTIADMLFYFPYRYDDYTRMKPLNRLVPGEVVTVIAVVRSVAKRQARGGRPYLHVAFGDGTGTMNVTFFGQLWLQRRFKAGMQVVISGEVELFRGELTMTNPEWEMLERDNLHTKRIVPVYRLTKGISARTLRRFINQAVSQWAEHIPDHLPESVLDRAELADLSWAIAQVHFPESFEAMDYARRRLTFDELFLFQMGMLGSRRDWQSVPGQPLHVSDDWLAAALDTLPYALTGAQQNALEQIRADITRDVPMNRLLQGDVGSGKTVVAALALATAVQNGKQAAIMAPTSILAEQHARSIGTLLRQLPGGEDITLRLLTGNTSSAERDEIYAGLAEGSIQVVIGTHALIQEGVNFNDLALAVIDEQHRFGVEQRGALRGKGTNPHLLVMTATPIPRTLALTIYADLDLTIIDEMPPGRTPIETRVLTPAERERAYDFITAQVERERQAFIVYPLVEASESLQDTGAAVDQYAYLSEIVFPKKRLGLLHGRLSPSEKDSVMSAFAHGEIDILVSTSVVEVGIDVPNATVIMIENADRFGLAQLHQFRGRVGRGEHKSFCLLVSTNQTAEAQQRLSAMEETTDGFRLAEIDWEMRGPGDLLGLRQSGAGQFRLAEIMNPRLVELAQREARTLYAEDPYLAQPEHHLLAQRIQTQLDQRADIS